MEMLGSVDFLEKVDAAQTCWRETLISRDKRANSFPRSCQKRCEDDPKKNVFKSSGSFDPQVAQGGAAFWTMNDNFKFRPDATRTPWSHALSFRDKCTPLGGDRV